MDKTMVFSLNDKDEILRKNLTIVYDALKEKGYNPINQIVGYILSEDPTYVTTHNNARAIISRMEREDILETLLKSFLNKKEKSIVCFQCDGEMNYSSSHFLFLHILFCKVRNVEKFSTLPTMLCGKLFYALKFISIYYIEDF